MMTSPASVSQCTVCGTQGTFDDTRGEAHCPACGTLLWVREDVSEVDTIRFVVRKLNNEVVVEQLVAQIFSRTDGPRKILVDFGPVEVISSAGLRKLITLQRSILATGRQLRLCCSNAQVYGTFVSTKLNQILNVYPDLKSATDGY